jgi:hypothetical protein
MEKGLEIKVNAIIESFNIYTGKITKVSKVHNLVVNTGLDRVADLIADISNTGFGFMAIGTDNTAVQATDTELGTEIKRLSVTPSDTGTGIILYDKTFTFSSGESYTIVEAGLFDSLTVSGSTIFNRLTFSGHSVDVDNGIRVKITVTVATP